MEKVTYKDKITYKEVKEALEIGEISMEEAGILIGNCWNCDNSKKGCEGCWEGTHSPDKTPSCWRLEE